MIPIEGEEEESESREEGRELARMSSGTLSRPSRPMTVGELELALTTRFPREQAEAWDKMGLLAGDPAKLITGVAVALDPTAAAVKAAAASGANVLVTHHPAFLDPPSRLTPRAKDSSPAGAVLYAAVSNGVALINVHTAFDVSPEAQAVLPGMLSLDARGLLEPLEGDAGLGYGVVCGVRASDAPLSLGQLAARCTSVFGVEPRVWGDSTQRISSVACANGSAGDMPDACVRRGIDCLVAGEVRYHAALGAAEAGLCIIELGHDVSELPFAGVLARCVADAGVDAQSIEVIDQSGNWGFPQAVRL